MQRLQTGAVHKAPKTQQPSNIGNWEIVPQEQTRGKTTMMVDVKQINCRPANANELAENPEEKFKGMATVLSLLFRHRKGSGAHFRVTAYKRGETIWFNLHKPEKIVPVEQKSKSVTRVTDDISALEGFRVVKSSTGGITINLLRRKLMERTRDEAFTESIVNAMNQAVYDRWFAEK